MVWLIIFNLAVLALIAAALRELIPPRLYSGLLRGLHYTIGISTPNDRQLRWTLTVWLFTVLIIVDGLAFLLAFLGM